MISQREARRLRKRVAELEAAERMRRSGGACAAASYRALVREQDGGK